MVRVAAGSCGLCNRMEMHKMTIKISPIAPALVFKSAVMFRKAFVDGGLFATMMPGVFSTAAALSDGLQTHEALSPTKHVYLPVDVALDDKGEPISVTPVRDHTAALARSLERLVERIGNYREAAAWPQAVREAIHEAREALDAAEGRS